MSDKKPPPTGAPTGGEPREKAGGSLGMLRGHGQHSKAKSLWLPVARVGIGRAIALHLAHEGADVVVHGRSAVGPSHALAEELCAEIHTLGRRAFAYAADIAIKEEVADMFAAVAKDLGRLDVLVLNAARAPFKETTRLLERDLRQLVETNLFGNVFCVQKALALLEAQGGKIVFLSSLGSRYMNPQYPLGPMKAAMESMVRQWAEELGPRGISANAVCAGLVKTDSYKTLRRLWPELASVPEAAFVTPEEVAEGRGLPLHRGLARHRRTDARRGPRSVQSDLARLTHVPCDPVRHLSGVLRPAPVAASRRREDVASASPVRSGRYPHAEFAMGPGALRGGAGTHGPGPRQPS